MLDHKAVTVLASGIVIDKSQFNTMGAIESGLIFSAAYGAGKPVLFVDNAGLFFSARTLMSLIDAGNSDWVLIAEKFKIELSPTDQATMKRAGEVRKMIAEAAIGHYELAPVPAAWVVEKRIKINKNLVQRIDEYGSSEGYSIGYKALQSVWEMASAFWAGTSKNNSISVAAAGYQKSAVAEMTSIQIGCTKVHRYEIEQVAIKCGWAFPSKA